MFELTKRRADTMNLIDEKLVAWSPTLPSPQCWMLFAAAAPSWWPSAITHLDEYHAAGMLEPTATQILGGNGAEDFVLVTKSGLGQEQCRQWRQAARSRDSDAGGW